MFQQKFIGRKKELAFLEQLYQEQKAQLVIFYGRRRVGKTELIRQFIKDKPHIFYLADERDDVSNLTELKKIMARYLGNPLLEKANILEWVELFEAFSKENKEKVIIVVDEFPYLIKSNSAIPSLFQKSWDLYLANKNIMLILLGSSVRMMETQVLGSASPLYGRRTAQWKLEPLPFSQVASFFPKYSNEELFQSYTALDGIPLYLLQFDPNQSPRENIKSKIFTKGMLLYQEVEILLRQELREPAYYFSILKAIAFGRNKFGEIVNFTQLDKTIISKYIETLTLLKIVEKEFPVTQKKETRQAHYVITDNYVRFWFRFVYPYKSLIEEDRQDLLFSQIKEDYQLYLSTIFERVCREFLQREARYGRMGRWWHKDSEIDVVGINEATKEIVFAECKWQENVDARALLKQLKEKAKLVDWHIQNRKESYVLFAKRFKEKIKEPHLRLFELEDLR